MAHSALWPKGWAVLLPRAWPVDLAIHRHPDTSGRAKSKGRERAQSRSRKTAVCKSASNDLCPGPGSPSRPMKESLFTTRPCPCSQARWITSLPSKGGQSATIMQPQRGVRKDQPFLILHIGSLLILWVPTDPPTFSLPEGVDENQGQTQTLTKGPTEPQRGCSFLLDILGHRQGRGFISIRMRGP